MKVPSGSSLTDSGIGAQPVHKKKRAGISRLVSLEVLLWSIPEVSDALEYVGDARKVENEQHDEHYTDDGEDIGAARDLLVDLPFELQ